MNCYFIASVDMNVRSLALLADPARVAMLMALMDGRRSPTSELATRVVTSMAATVIAVRPNTLFMTRSPLIPEKAT